MDSIKIDLCHSGKLGSPLNEYFSSISKVYATTNCLESLIKTNEESCVTRIEIKQCDVQKHLKQIGSLFENQGFTVKAHEKDRYNVEFLSMADHRFTFVESGATAH